MRFANSLGRFRLHLLTTHYSHRKRSLLLRFLPWWESVNSGIRVVRSGRRNYRAQSIALFKSWKDRKWHFHCGPAWKA